MRQDYFYNKKELRIAIDTKLVDWIVSLGFKPFLVSDLKTLNFLFNQDKFKIKGIVLSGGNEINKNSLRYKIEKQLAAISKKKKIPLLGICHGLQFINFLEDVEKIGRSLRIADKSYNDAMQKLSTGRGNLVSKLEKIKNLGAKTSKKMPKNLIND